MQENQIDPRTDRKRMPNVERDIDTTLAALKRVLESKISKTRLPKNLIKRIRQAVTQAEAELVENHVLSETTVIELDSVFAESRK